MAGQLAECSARETRAAAMIVHGIAGLHALSEGGWPGLLAPLVQEFFVLEVFGVEDRWYALHPHLSLVSGWLHRSARRSRILFLLCRILHVYSNLKSNYLMARWTPVFFTATEMRFPAKKEDEAVSGLVDVLAVMSSSV